MAHASSSCSLWHNGREQLDSLTARPLMVWSAVCSPGLGTASARELASRVTLPQAPGAVTQPLGATQVGTGTQGDGIRCPATHLTGARASITCHTVMGDPTGTLLTWLRTFKASGPGLGTWLSWESARLACTRPGVQCPTPKFPWNTHGARLLGAVPNKVYREAQQSRPQDSVEPVAPVVAQEETWHPLCCPEEGLAGEGR